MNHSQNNRTYISGEIIPRHQVKGDDLFHLDHYESTVLTITSEGISIVDYYFSCHETIPDSPLFELKVKRKDSIARLIQYFGINACKDEDLQKCLYKALAGYAQEQGMESLDLFGKLFKEISVEFESTCYI